jgi:Glycosyl transferase family 8
MMIKATDISQPIRVFIGSSPKNSIEEAVFRYSLLKHAGQDIEIYVINGLAGSVTCLSTGEVQQFPPQIAARIKGSTAFSLARWAIPQWCQYQGKAIYCDSDQLAFTDIAELWHLDLGDHFLAAVPVQAAYSNERYLKAVLKKHMQPDDERYLASVMLMNCERFPWTLEGLIDCLDNKEFILGDLMFLSTKFRQYFKIAVQALPSEWNHLDATNEQTKILHFTDLTSQPWLYDHNPTADIWEASFLEAIEQGFLSQSEVVDAYQRGWISKRIQALPLLSPLLRDPFNRLWRRWNVVGFRISQWGKTQLKGIKQTLKTTVRPSSLKTGGV